MHLYILHLCTYLDATHDIWWCWLVVCVCSVGCGRRVHSCLVTPRDSTLARRVNHRVCRVDATPPATNKGHMPVAARAVFRALPFLQHKAVLVVTDVAMR